LYDSVTWILTADDWNAQIHVSRSGMSFLLHTLRNRLPEPFEETIDGEPEARSTHLCFAHDILWLLSEGDYDGLIIMATPAMTAALAQIGAPLVRKRVLAEFVMAAPIGNPIREGEEPSTRSFLPVARAPGRP
jgi:hypothetical protein